MRETSAFIDTSPDELHYSVILVWAMTPSEISLTQRPQQTPHKGSARKTSTDAELIPHRLLD